MVHILTRFPPDTTVELAGRDDCFLTDVAQLILEIGLNGRNIDKARLSCRESSRGVWYADQILIV
jgi:hypothetical protein